MDSPCNNCPTNAPEIEANKSGIKEAIVRSNIKISMAKMVPAMGALKIAAIAPAAPHPINKVFVLKFKWKNLPKLEAIAAPVETIGASNPTEPPKPTVSVLATR